MDGNNVSTPITYKKEKNKDIMQIILLSLMYSAPSLILLEKTTFSFDTIITRYLSVLICSIIFVIHFIKKYSIKPGVIFIPFYTKNKLILTIWLLFSGFTIASQAVNGEMPSEGIYYFIFIPLVFFIMIPMVLNDANKKILIAIFISSAIFLILSLLMEPITLGRSYSGITQNSNSLGYLATQSAIGSFGILLSSYILKRRTLFIIFIFTFVFSSALVLISNSRTSFIVLIITCILIALLFIKVNNIKLTKLIGIFILLLVAYFWGLKDFLEAGILNKFDELSSSGNLLNNRSEIWGRVIEEMTIFGHGSNYFENVIFISPHSTIFSVIGQNGIIAGIMIIVFYLTISIYSVKYAFEYKGNMFSFVPFAIIISFIMFSMTEGMLGTIGKGLTLAFFNVIGLLIFHRKPQKLSQKK